MVKTITDIWRPQRPNSSRISHVSSDTTLLSTHDLYTDEDIATFSDVPCMKLGGPKPGFDDITSETSFYKTGAVLRDSKVFRSACLSIINSAITRLSILINVHKPQVGEMLVKPYIYKPLQERYAPGNATHYNNYVLGETYTNLHKMQKEVKEVLTVLQELREEIEMYGIVTCLDTFSSTYTKMKDDEEKLLLEWVKKQHICSHLMDSLRNDKTDTLVRFRNMDLEIGKITVELKDLMEYSNASVRFAKKWQGSRHEQNSMVLKRSEGGFQSVIGGMEEKMRLEDICHANIDKFLTEAKDDFQDDIQNWMDVYDREYEERDMQILNMKHRTDQLISKKEALQEQYERRQKEMDDYLEYKRVKKEREERMALELWGAVKIQAWWRGVMFRKKLGPYRPKKKKNKKGGNKNKKGKRKK